VRVLIISHMFPNPADSTAGIFVLEQVKALQRLGIDCSVICPVPWVPHSLAFLERGRKYTHTQTESIIEGIYVGYPKALELPGGRLFALYGFSNYVSSRARANRWNQQHVFDLIHAHSIMPDGFAAVLLGQEFRVPVVCTVHGGDANDYPFRNRATHAATTWALKRFSQVIAVSTKLKQQLRDLSDIEKVEVAHNGADAAVFRIVPKLEARQRLGIPAGERVVVFVGYLVAEKGIRYLLEALSQINLQNLKLYLIGDGYLRSKLEENARHFGVSQRCVFIGQCEHSEVPFWLSACDCFTLPSVSEGLPTILPEAMFCGAPIVATSVGGIPEIVHDGETGILVRACDSRALASAIRALLINRTLANDLARSAERYALAHLSWEANALKTSSVYGEVLNSSQRALLQTA
jgi:teichuronic acid biosynthesis glycosyltransferase TuaC